MATPFKCENLILHLVSDSSDFLPRTRHSSGGAAPPIPIPLPPSQLPGHRHPLTKPWRGLISTLGWLCWGIIGILSSLAQLGRWAGWWASGMGYTELQREGGRVAVGTTMMTVPIPHGPAPTTPPSRLHAARGACSARQGKLSLPQTKCLYCSLSMLTPSCPQSLPTWSDTSQHIKIQGYHR